MKVPFVVYADFETFTEEISTREPNQDKSFTHQYQRHRPSGFCYKIVCFDKKIHNPKPVHYRARSEEDIGQKFVEMLEEDIKKIHQQFDFSKKMIPLTKEDWHKFEKATVCWICRNEFDESQKKSERSLSFYWKVSWSRSRQM